MLSNQDKKEMLEMIADAIRNTNVISHSENSLIDSMARAIRFKASSIPQDKPERKMPRYGETSLWLSFNSDRRFRIVESKWFGSATDKLDWDNGLQFLLSERELAEKKVDELNKILAS